MQIKFRRVHPSAILPSYATPGSACFDLYACGHATIQPGCSAKIRTGLQAEFPQGFVMLMFSRSGHADKYAARLENCVGVIDSDYRGEILVMLRNDGKYPYGERPIPSMMVKPGDRIAQAMVIPCYQHGIVEAEELGETMRGAGGFGSTGE